MNVMFIIRCISILITLTSFNVIAEVNIPTSLNGGTIFQELQPSKSLIRRSNDNYLQVESSEEVALPDSAPFQVLALKVVGNESIDLETLHALIQDKEGQELSLRQLGELASLITSYYHNHDYPLAIAIIPSQTIQDGVVTIQVLEASYGNVLLTNKSRVNQQLLNRSLSGLKSGKKIAGDNLNKTLLLLNDIPGLLVDASIKKGQVQGTSDLIINTKDAVGFKAYASLANSGSASIGRVRGTANLDLVDPLGLGDVLSVNGLTSGSGMNYGRLSYELLVNGYGTRVGGAYSNLHYQLGQQYKALKVHGTSNNYSLWVKQPLIRSLNSNLYAQLEYDRTILKDHIDIISAKTDRTIDNVALNLSGDLRDSWLLGGMSYFNISFSAGHVGFDDATAQHSDFLAGKTQGDFSKLNLSVTKIQQISDGITFSGSFSGQVANDNLDSSQKMVIGGPNSVRAYDVSVLSGDNAQLLTLELRKTISSSIGVWQAVTFYDAGHVEINNSPWTASKNEAFIQGVGLGLNWQHDSLWGAHVSLATPIGSEPSLVSSSSIGSRAWAEIRKDF